MQQIAGHLQDYAWGVPGGLREWRSNVDLAAPIGPEAELWFGAHVNGPSPLLEGQVGETLRDVVEAGEAPILVKLLAAARPLSIQIHPPTALAQQMFAAQQAGELPPLLADSLAKTEMLVALRPFSVLQGLRDPALAGRILRKLGGSAALIADVVESGDAKAAIRLLLALPADELAALTPGLPAAATAAGLDEAGIEALGLVARDYPGDPGVLVAALLDHQVLAEGEAVYVPAGVVHAYVSGTGVEVMTSSDNVLRLGLTPKTVAVDEALAALDPQLRPQRIAPAAVATADGGVTRTFAPAGAPFLVQQVSEGSVTIPAGRYRLVLSVHGATTVSSDGVTVQLDQGEAVALLADEADVIVTAAGSAFITSETG